MDIFFGSDWVTKKKDLRQNFYMSADLFLSEKSEWER
jgi:hypothetical protein